MNSAKVYGFEVFEPKMFYLAKRFKWPIIHMTSLSSLWCISVLMFLKVLCCLSGFCSNTFAWFNSCSTSFKSRSDFGWECIPDKLATAFTASNWSKTGCRVPMAFPILMIAFSLLFALRPAIASLHSRFRCSMKRSHGMLRPAIPLVFIHLLHISWCESLREKP